MDLFNLSAKLTLDTSDYDKKIDDAKQKTEDYEKVSKKSLGVVIANAWAQISAKIIEVSKQIAQVAKQTIDYADSIGDLAQQWGFTTREIQEFNYWATMNGTTIESVMTGMRGLVNQARAGSDAFEQLGVSVKNADGSFKDQKTLFLETLDALNKMPNQTQRNALQFQIFGRAGIELGQIVNKTSDELQALSDEAERFGLIMSEEATEKAGAFNDALDRLKLKGKTAFAELILGVEGGKEKFDDFLKDVEVATDKLIPVAERLGEKLLGAVFRGIVKRVGYNFDRLLKLSVGKGWLWGEKFWEREGSLPSRIAEGISDIQSGGSLSRGSSSIFETTNNTSKREGDNYNINIDMTTSGYNEEDARKLADDIIRQIVTKRQAKG